MIGYYPTVEFGRPPSGLLNGTFLDKAGEGLAGRADGP